MAGRLKLLDEVPHLPDLGVHELLDRLPFTGAISNQAFEVLLDPYLVDAQALDVHLDRVQDSLCCSEALLELWAHALLEELGHARRDLAEDPLVASREVSALLEGGLDRLRFQVQPLVPLLGQRLVEDVDRRCHLLEVGVVHGPLLLQRRQPRLRVAGLCRDDLVLADVHPLDSGRWGTGGGPLAHAARDARRGRARWGLRRRPFGLDGLCHADLEPLA